MKIIKDQTLNLAKDIINELVPLVTTNKEMELFALLKIAMTFVENNDIGALEATKNFIAKKVKSLQKPLDK